LLFAGAVCAEDAAKDDGVFEPGVRHVCVPAGGGDGWDCGTEDAPPANYQPPIEEPAAEAAPNSEPAAVAQPEPMPEPEPDVEATAESAPAPPPFLADPMRDTPYAPVEESASEPHNAAEAVIAAEAVTPESTPEAVPEPAPEAVPEPELVSVPEPVVAAPEPPSAPEMTGAVALGNADAFSRLPASAFTLQLAYAANTAEFASLVAALGLDPARCYVLRVRGVNGPTWLLAYGDFADANAAKVAQARLPKASVARSGRGASVRCRPKSRKDSESHVERIRAAGE
jgi:hypothetical protein